MDNLGSHQVNSLDSQHLILTVPIGRLLVTVLVLVPVWTVQEMVLPQAGGVELRMGTNIRLRVAVQDPFKRPVLLGSPQRKVGPSSPAQHGINLNDIRVLQQWARLLLTTERDFKVLLNHGVHQLVPIPSTDPLTWVLGLPIAPMGNPTPCHRFQLNRWVQEVRIRRAE